MAGEAVKQAGRTVSVGEPTPDAPPFSQLFDLNLAWRRLKRDRPDRVFATHPFLFDVIEHDLNGWLVRTAAELDAGYAPRDCLSFHVPKPNWLARPGATLDLADELVYSAIVGALYSHIWARLGALQGTHDLAYQLRAEANGVEWTLSGFSVWRQWREKSLTHFERGIQFVLFADISAFYENIDLHRLRSDVASLAVDDRLVTLLLTCVHRWAQPRGKGIPQGYSASDILAKLYMNPVDQALVNAGFPHLRYVDDIRIFCRSSLEAKQALLKLNDLLRHRGLNLQSAKTCILRADDALHKIDGVTPTINAIAQRLKDELVAIAGDMGSPITLDDLQRISLANPDAPPTELLEQAFEDNFSSVAMDFDKTLLHYLLTRLGRVKSRVAVRYCIDLIQRRPEETEFVLRYLSAIRPSDDDVAQVVGFLESPDSIFDFQRFQVVRWLYEDGQAPVQMLALSRAWAFDRNRDSHLRAYCIAILGRSGNAADLEMIENSFAAAASELERVEIVCSLANMETGRRNAFYGRVRDGSNLIRAAVNWARRPRPAQ